MEAFTTEEFERSFKDLYKPLCLFALRFTGQIDDAEDIVQQAFADVWDKKNAIPTIENLKSYLYRSVRNRSLNVAMKPSGELLTDEFPEMGDDSAEEQVLQAERDARLWTAIDHLPSERKKIFLLAKRDGLKYQEIAEELHISIKTVENQMGKALKSLRETVLRIYYFFFGIG
ncbi:MAG: RNA polymerase sigma-70 factor [Tannerellaceae bacterium]|nr:RNA polymerase sigma-70 factor [Tannerellaceae bacterium]